MLFRLVPEKLVLNFASTISESFSSFRAFKRAFEMVALKLNTGNLGLRFTPPSKTSFTFLSFILSLPSKYFLSKVPSIFTLW
ncbi:hypothetical protein D3C87_1108860 [compost metagenome]